MNTTMMNLLGAPDRIHFANIYESYSDQVFVPPKLVFPIFYIPAFIVSVQDEFLLPRHFPY